MYTFKIHITQNIQIVKALSTQIYTTERPNKMKTNLKFLWNAWQPINIDFYMIPSNEHNISLGRIQFINWYDTLLPMLLQCLSLFPRYDPFLQNNSYIGINCYFANGGTIHIVSQGVYKSLCLLTYFLFIVYILLIKIR